MKMSQLPFPIIEIKPKVTAPQSDKFSRNLYNWLRYNKGLGAGVYCLQRNYGDGKFEPFLKDHAMRPDIIVGMDDGAYINGSRVQQIIIGNKRPIAIPKTNETLDITDWFWTEYLKRGRCLMDGDHDNHLMYDEHRYASLGNEGIRCCNWCGCIQELRIETIEVKREHWICKQR